MTINMAHEIEEGNKRTELRLAVADELCRVGERVLAAETDKDKTLARARLEEVVAKYKKLSHQEVAR